MFSRSLLLVLLVLACVQSFTTAESGPAPNQCCFSYQKHPIPVRLITKYEVTERQCTKPGVIFTLKNGTRACADPRVQWVQKHMDKLTSA